MTEPGRWVYGSGMTKALKFLTAEGKGRYSGFAWPLPKDGKPGAWVRVKGDLVACENGIHACTLEQSFKWLNERCFIIELGGRVIDNGDKLVARKGRLVREVTRWNPSNARLFAADCAEHVLPIFEKARPNDARVRECIEVARRYARGEATEAERAAAGAAAWDAAATRAAAGAGAAAWDAAAAAAGAAAWDAAATRAAAAARAAAWAAAAAGAGDAAWAAAAAWQLNRLNYYLRVKKELG